MHTDIRKMPHPAKKNMRRIMIRILPMKRVKYKRRGGGCNKGEKRGQERIFLQILQEGRREVAIFLPPFWRSGPGK
jgi:hypothetical protein